MCFFFKGLRGNLLCVCRGGGGGAKTPTLDPVCIQETPEKMIVWSLPPQMKNPRYGPDIVYRRFEDFTTLFMNVFKVFVR